MKIVGGFVVGFLAGGATVTAIIRKGISLMAQRIAEQHRLQQQHDVPESIPVKDVWMRQRQQPHLS